MKSVIHESDVVDNANPHHNAALTYYPARLVRDDGSEAGLLFTADDVEDAEIRGAANPEDVPSPSNRQTWLLIALVLAVALLIAVR